MKSGLVSHWISAASLAPLLAVSAAPAAEVRLDLVSGYAFSEGGAPNGDSLAAQISPNGRYLALSSGANNLLPGFTDENLMPDALVLDRQTGELEYVSLSAGDPLRSGNDLSIPGGISDDGRWVLISSEAKDLIAGGVYPSPDLDAQLFLFDRSSRTTQLVSHAPGSPLTAGDAGATAIRLSADGRFALFESKATNLVSPPAPGTRQVYLFDRQSGEVRLVSHAAGAPGTAANSDSHAVDLSADGRVLLFESYATDLLAGLTDFDGTDVYAYDRVSGATELISRRAAAPTFTTTGTARDLSPDGRFVLLDSTSTTLAPGLTNGGGGRDVFVFDRQSGSARLASRSAASATTTADGASTGLALSDDGRFVYLLSLAQNLVAPFTDGNGASDDLYLFDALSGTVTLASHAAGDPARGGNGRVERVSSQQRISPDGRFALYYTLATDLQAGVTDSTANTDLYLYDRVAGQSALVSRRGGSLEAGGGLWEPKTWLVTAGGDTFFSSRAALDPATDDPVPQVDLFHFDPAAAANAMVTKAAFAGVTTLPYGADGIGVLTPNGRFVTFFEYVWDREGSRLAERVAHAAGNPAAPGNVFAMASAITPDGRYVLLDSSATDLLTGVTDTNARRDVFLYDRTVLAPSLISHAAGQPARTGNGTSASSWISADGSKVALYSTSRNLVPGQTGGGFWDDLFVYDRASASAEMISHHHASTTQGGGRGTTLRDVSDDGRYLVYTSGYTALVPGFVDGNDYVIDGDTYTLSDLYFYDRVTRTNTLISHRPELPSHGALEASPLAAFLSADASAVYYGLRRRTATVSGPDAIYRWDRATNTSTLMTAIGGGPLAPCGDNASLDGVTPDGRHLLITTPCAFVAGDTNGALDVYLIDRQAGVKLLITHQPGNPAIATGARGGDHVSADGRRVVYRDGAGVPHSYERATRQATRLTSSYFDPALPVQADVEGASGDGRYVLVSTYKRTLVPRDNNPNYDLFLVSVAVDVFADGFESGATGAWSSTVGLPAVR